jgi:hypothetical protein
MNTTLPPSRDLPPHRHHEIRTAVLDATVGRPTGRRLLAPLFTAAAALAIVGLVAYFVPWGQGDDVTSAGQPTETTSVSPATPETPGATGAPQVDGVTPAEATAITQGCARSAGVTGEFTLSQLLTDEAGRYALVYSDKWVLGCTLDDGLMDYNSGLSGLRQFTPPVSYDLNGASAGGDVPGNKPEYAGQHGTEVVAGRVAPEVAKVTATRGADSVEARIQNGTYVVRIVHPTTWEIPVAEDWRPPMIRAYDKNGTLLAEVGP